MYSAGKEALLMNPGRFNHEASDAFKRMSQEERDDLMRYMPEPSHMSKGDVNKRATTIFRKIQKSVIIIICVVFINTQYNYLYRIKFVTMYFVALK